MPLRLGFDLDGVLADMEGELVRQAEDLFGEAMTRRLLEGPPTANVDVRLTADTTGTAAIDTDTTNAADADGAVENDPGIVKLQMTSRQTRRLWRHIETIENFWESLDENEPGAISKLAALVADRRWEVIFLTKRPRSAGWTAQVQSQRWLQSKGFALPSVFVVQGNRGLIAAALDLDFVVDDRPENCLDVVVDSKARAILVWRDDEKQLPAAARRLGIGVVKTVDECLNILSQVDVPGAEQSGIVDRVMRLLGLKEPAKV